MTTTRTRRLIETVTRPIVGGILGGLLVLVVVGQPTSEIHVVERVVVRERVPGTTRVVHFETAREVCDTRTITRLVNRLVDALARTGTAGVAGNANADEVAQVSAARSGDAVVGQVIRQINVCGTATIEATNTVTNSEARTGDATASNEATVERENEPVPTPDEAADVSSPTPVVGEVVATPSPSPSPTLED